VKKRFKISIIILIIFVCVVFLLPLLWYYVISESCTVRGPSEENIMGITKPGLCEGLGVIFVVPVMIYYIIMMTFGSWILNLFWDLQNLILNSTYCGLAYLTNSSSPFCQ